MTIVILIFSIFFQLIGAVLALRLIRLSRGWAAWVLIAAALALRTARLVGDLDLAIFQGLHPTLFDAIFGLAFSLLTTAGVYAIRPLFTAFRNTLEENQNLLRTTEEQRRLAEQRAREAEEGRNILEAVMEFIPECITIAGAEGEIRLASSYCQTLSGHSREALETTRFGEHAEKWHIYHADGVTPAKDEQLPLLRAVREGEIVVNEEWIVQRPDGSPVTVLANAGPIRDKSDRIAGGIIAWRDISERVRAAEQLRRAKEEAELSLSQLRAIFTGMNEGIVFCAPDGKILDANPAALAIFNLPDVRGVQQFLEDFRTDILLSTLDGRGIALEAWPIRRALRGESFTNYELQARRISGDTSKILSFNGAPVRDQSGATVLAMITIRDVTAVKQAETALRESESRYRLLAESAPIGVFECDAEGRCVYANLQWALISGRSREKTLGFGWMEAIEPEDRQRILKDWQRASSARRPWAYEYRILKPDGKRIWVRALTTPTAFQDGTPTRFVGTIEDITTRKRIEETLRQAKEAAEDANRAKNEFLGNMSHEFRTPMTVIMAVLEHLLEAKPLPDQRHYLEMAQTSAESLLRLIEDILDLSKIEARKLSFEATPFDLRQSVENTVDMFRLNAEKKQLVLHLDISPKIPQLLIGDPDRVRQILVNLIGNAVKFTELGEVAVQVDLEQKASAFARSESVLFTIRDTGIGIPEDKVNRLFQSFSQVDASHTRKFGGTGLGLALCKRLAEGMGGSVRVESKEGEGSTFFLSLPFLRAPFSSPSPSPGTKQGSLSSAANPPRPHILLAEDDPMVSQLVVMMLRNKNWRVTTVADGKEAVRFWEKDAFDLILMDVQMPEEDGFAATRAIRQKEKTTGAHIPIIALTAHARREDRRQCFEAGMDDYLAKPIKTELLYAAVERTLEHSPSSDRGEGEQQHPAE